MAARFLDSARRANLVQHRVEPAGFSVVCGTNCSHSMIAYRLGAQGDTLVSRRDAVIPSSVNEEQKGGTT